VESERAQGADRPALAALDVPAAGALLVLVWFLQKQRLKK
jgi:hypothetical protein